MHDPIKAVVFGDSGAGKSTFASSFPKRMLVCCFDSVDKSRPYMKRGASYSEIQEDEYGVQYREVYNKKGNVLIRIEYYIDSDPDHPTAYAQFRERMARLQYEYDEWMTIVIDSVSQMELYARYREKKTINPHTKEPRQWFAGATDALEEMLMMRFPALPMNVVVLCHVDEDKDEVHGFSLRNPSAPGRLRKKLASQYGELYHAVVRKGDQKGDKVYQLQTRSDNLFQAASQIDAPDPCEPLYTALWANWDASPEHANERN